MSDTLSTLRPHPSSQQFRTALWKVILVSFAALLIGTQWSCASPEAIATFAGSAQKALAVAPPLFGDIHDSCVRRQSLRPNTPILPAFVPPDSKDAPAQNPPALAACTRFASQAQALGSVSNTLSDYFKAVQQLASFDATGVSGANESAAANAASAAGLSYPQIESAGKLASVVTRAFTEGYQRRRLLEYLRDADPAVANITQGLENVIKNYLDFLQEEQQTTTARYQSVADTNQKAVLLLLNRAYSEDVVQIGQRRSSAQAFTEALRAIREGHRQLVQSARHLNAKRLSLALQPYTSKLDGLMPALQRNN
jgi:hypothetical protein